LPVICLAARGQPIEDIRITYAEGLGMRPWIGAVLATLMLVVAATAAVPVRLLQLAPVGPPGARDGAGQASIHTTPQRRPSPACTPFLPGLKAGASWRGHW
jgi:hypothetical protein